MNREVLIDVPVLDRPREKAMKYGINYCSNSELIAIILRTGTKDLNVLEVSRNIVNSLTNLSDLLTYTVSDFCKFKGVNKVKALELQAAILLGLRIATDNKNILTLNEYNSLNTYQKYKSLILDKYQEKALLIFINHAGKEIGIKEFVGSTFNINMDLNTIKCLIFELKPKKLLILHSHISGPINPSSADLKLTLILNELCNKYQIILLDHLIISTTEYFSFKDHELINN